MSWYSPCWIKNCNDFHLEVLDYFAFRQNLWNISTFKELGIFEIGNPPFFLSCWYCKRDNEIYPCFLLHVYGFYIQILGYVNFISGSFKPFTSCVKICIIEYCILRVYHSWLWMQYCSFFYRNFKRLALWVVSHPIYIHLLKYDKCRFWYVYMYIYHFQLTWKINMGGVA